MIKQIIQNSLPQVQIKGVGVIIRNGVELTGGHGSSETADPDKVIDLEVDISEVDISASSTDS